MPSTKRDRDYARRRHADWQARRSSRERQRRQRRATVLTALAVLVVLAVVGVAVYVGFGTRGGSSQASTSASAGASPSAGRSASSGPSASATAPPASVAQGRTWAGTIATSKGSIGVTLDGAKAPKAVASFVTLAGKGFFDKTPCHRLVTQGIFVLQCGDPTGKGTGGPGYTFGPVENAPADNVYPAGTIAMARQGNNGSSQGSQFFLVYADSTIPADSAGGYTVFGHITSGLDVVTGVAAGGSNNSNGTGDGAPKTPISIEQVSVK